jgi:hypothetical protein
MGSFTATLLDALLSAGVSRERAMAVVDQLERAIDERFGLHAQVLATKRDVAELQVTITRQIAESNERIAGTNERIAETNERIAALDGSVSIRIAALEGSVSTRIAALDGSVSARIAALDGNVSARIAALDGNVSARIAALDGSVSARIAETKADLVKWMLGALTAQTALILGALKLF